MTNTTIVIILYQLTTHKHDSLNKKLLLHDLEEEQPPYRMFKQAGSLSLRKPGDVVSSLVVFLFFEEEEE